MANLATGVWEDPGHTVVLVVQNGNAPSAEEWSQWVAIVATHLARPQTVGLAITDGGAPNARQRDEMNRALGGVHRRSAVVSESMLVRGVVTAMSWFNPQTIAFSPRAILDAMKFLGIVEEPRRRALWNVVLKVSPVVAPRSTSVGIAAASLPFHDAPTIAT